MFTSLSDKLIRLLLLTLVLGACAESSEVPGEPAYRVTHSGGFSNDENPLRVSFRTFHDPLQRGIGFRCATNTIQ